MTHVDHIHIPLIYTHTHKHLLASHITHMVIICVLSVSLRTLACTPTKTNPIVDATHIFTLMCCLYTHLMIPGSILSDRTRWDTRPQRTWLQLHPHTLIHRPEWNEKLITIRSWSDYGLHVRPSRLIRLIRPTRQIESLFPGDVPCSNIIYTHSMRFTSNYLVALNRHTHIYSLKRTHIIHPNSNL